MLKSRDSGLKSEVVARHILGGGFIDSQSFISSYESNDLSGIIAKLKPYIDVSRAVKRYSESRNIAEFEVEVDNVLIDNYFWRFRMHDPLFRKNSQSMDGVHHLSFPRIFGQGRGAKRIHSFQGSG